jgi:hypothetical protein
MKLIRLYEAVRLYKNVRRTVSFFTYPVVFKMRCFNAIALNSTVRKTMSIISVYYYKPHFK